MLIGKQQPKFFLTMPWFVIFYGILAAMFFLFMTRNSSFWADVPIVGAVSANQHFSNFILCYLVIAGAGVLALIMGESLRRMYYIAAGFIVLNIVIEFGVTIVNTKDPVDAWYGIAGTLAAVGMLLLVRKYGLTKSKA